MVGRYDTDLCGGAPRPAEPRADALGDQSWEYDVNREISLSAQDITQAEIDAVVAVMRSERLSLGPRIPEFEAEFTKRLRVKHAIACSSGTAGLHMCWRALGVGRGDDLLDLPSRHVGMTADQELHLGRRRRLRRGGGSLGAVAG